METEQQLFLELNVQRHVIFYGIQRSEDKVEDTYLPLSDQPAL